MKQFLLALAAFSSFQTLSAQEVTYLLFDRNCMNQLEYRYSYPNLKGENSVWAYSIKPNMQEHYVFMTEGAGHYSPEMPDAAVTCRNLDLDDSFVARINREETQLLIVFQRQSGGYWMMPVQSATLVARRNSKYWVRAAQSSFQFDTLRMVNEQNLAVVGSPTAAYFSGAKLNNCLMEYSFHCEPVKSGQIRSDFQFIPSIGIVNDRTGKSASAAKENELQLVKVNGLALDDYISEACPEGTGKIAMSKYQKPANYGDDSFEADKEISSIMQKEQKGETPAVYSTDGNGIECAEQWEPGTHIVQRKENLRAIARTYKVKEQDLIKWNNIQNPDRIEVCQKLWLKPPPSKTSKRGVTNNDNKVKPQVYDAQPDNTKTVRKQGLTQTSKNYDPNRPIEYSEGTADENDYNYFQSDNDNKTRIHTVHRGEYLYKIAKMYSCPEECIRIANGMALEGDEPLSIGQKLIIPECTCTVDGRVINRPTAPAKQPTVKKQDLNNRAAQSNKTRTSILDESEPPAAVEYNYDDDRVYKDNDRSEDASMYEDDASRTGPEDKASKVQLYKEHLVRQGETLKSIAAKYKVDASKLAKANGLKPKDEPTPGKTFLIPIEEEEEKTGSGKTGGKKDQGYNPYYYEESGAKYAPGTSPNRKPASGLASTRRPGYAPAQYSNTSASKQPAKQNKPRTSILDDDTMPESTQSASKTNNRYLDEDRDDAISGKEPAKPKTTRKPLSDNAAVESKSTQHIVKKGETIESIAKKYGVSPFELSQINNVAIDDALIPGKKIWIPEDEN